MKVFFISICISMVLVSCGSQPKSSSTIPYIVAKNYFVKNTIEDKLIELSITNQKDFDNLFGVAHTMGPNGKPTPIDFNSQYVIAVINPISDDVSKLECKALDMKLEKLILHYSIEKTDKQSFQSRHALILVVDRTYQKDIEFIKEK